MTKKKMWDNSNLVQEEIIWGNIQLPGISDEKLLNTNWNRVQASKELVNSSEWKNKIKQRTADPDYKQKHSKAIDKRNNRKDWKQIRQGVGDKLKKKVMTPDGIFDSRSEAAKFYGITPPGIKRRIEYHPDKYYYID